MNILDVQKFENTEVRLNCENCSLSEIINKSILEISALLEEKNLSINFTEQSSFFVYVDSGLIDRVVMNILSNAIKYSENNAQLIIHCHEIPDESGVKVSITDFGQGIDPDKISQVFDKFAQIEVRKSGALRSTGLGLAFCKMVIEAHYGKIGAESVPNQSTTFWFTLKMSELQKNTANFDILISHKKTDVLLTVKDVEYLNSFITGFKKLKYYESGKILPLLSTVDEHFSETVALWKKEFENAVYTNNEKKFNELIRNQV
jgi:hypothetical protein